MKAFRWGLVYWAKGGNLGGGVLEAEILPTRDGTYLEPSNQREEQKQGELGGASQMLVSLEREGRTSKHSTGGEGTPGQTTGCGVRGSLGSEEALFDPWTVKEQE